MRHIQTQKNSRGKNNVCAIKHQNMVNFESKFLLLIAKVKYFSYVIDSVLKFGWYLQLEKCSMIRQLERIQIYSQSSQTPLTDCFTPTGSRKNHETGNVISRSLPPSATTFQPM